MFKNMPSFLYLFLIVFAIVYLLSQLIGITAIVLISVSFAITHYLHIDIED